MKEKEDKRKERQTPKRALIVARALSASSYREERAGKRGSGSESGEGTERKFEEERRRDGSGETSGTFLRRATDRNPNCW